MTGKVADFSLSITTVCVRSDKNAWIAQPKIRIRHQPTGESFKFILSLSNKTYFCILFGISFGLSYNIHVHRILTHKRIYNPLYILHMAHIDSGQSIAFRFYITIGC